MDRAEAIEILAQTDVWDEEAQEAFDMAIAALREQEQSQWISVKERLPERGEVVLCYFNYEPESPNVICENKYFGGGRWMSEESKVTHWMPLPEPPKEG